MLLLGERQGGDDEGESAGSTEQREAVAADAEQPAASADETTEPKTDEQPPASQQPELEPGPIGWHTSQSAPSGIELSAPFTGVGSLKPSTVAI